MIEERVRARDGLELATRHWPANGPGGPWAAVLLVHGLGEHSGRWEHVGRRLSGQGLDVHTWDQRGFGRSEGRRAYVERWHELHDDLADRVATIRQANLQLPIAVYGHSLGGVVALGAVLDGRTSPEMLVLSAPGLDVTIPGWKRLAAAVLGRLAPTIEIPNDFDPALLSRDPEVQRRYRDDPLNHHRTTTRFGRLGIDEQTRLRGLLDRLETPTLVLHAAEDRLVPTGSSAPFEGHPMVTRRLYPGLAHELHNEPEGPLVIADIVSWMRGRQVTRDGGQASARFPSQPNIASGERSTR